MKFDRLVTFTGVWNDTVPLQKVWQAIGMNPTVPLDILG